MKRNRSHGLLLLIALAVLAMLAVSACGDGGGGPGSEPGDRVDNPINVSKNVQLTEEAFKAILAEIGAAGKYVNLDLSLCTLSDKDTGAGLRSDGTFDVFSTHSTYSATGMDRIVSLILPDRAKYMASWGGFSRDFTNLANVSASAVIYIGAYDFQEGDENHLVSVNFPQVTEIGGDAFNGCAKLTSVNFPQVTKIGGGAFGGCAKLTSVDFPQALSIQPFTFYDCISLTNVNFPQATVILDEAFSGCTSLASANFPQVEGIYGGPFIFIGSTPLTINLGLIAPELGVRLFSGVNSTKIVTVKVPNGATGYGTIPGYYSGTDVTPRNLGNGFRGAGWNGSSFPAVNAEILINTNITLNVVYQD